MNIEAIARRTGVPAATLRKWEQRYGVLRPERTAGLHRRYSERDVLRVEWLKARLEEGYRIGEAARLLAGDGAAKPMWERVAERLEGRLVVLEPLARRHAEGLYEAARDDRIWRWMRVHLGESRGAFDSWLATALENAARGVEAPFAIFERAAGRLVGSTRYLALRPEHRSVEIGWTWLTPSAWGTGVNAEAKLLLLDHAFERLGCMRVEFKTDPRNERARRSLEGLQAGFEGVLRRHLLVAGAPRDSAYYSVIDEEWPEVRRALLARLEAKR